jgi:peptidylprolyl isomerase
VGSEKRERQKLSRQAKIEAAEIAARRTRTKRTGIRVAVAAIVVIGAMFAYSAISGGDDDDEATDDAASENTSTTVPETTTTTYSNPELAEEVLGREAPDPEAPPADTAKDALETTTLIEGEGEGAAVGDTVVVHYIGKTSDGEVFDESWSTGPVTLGPTANVIAGWNEGLVGVKIGERRHLLIGSEKGYGAQGGGDAIPPDAPLAFDVDVVDIIKAAPTETGTGAGTTTAPAG